MSLPRLYLTRQGALRGARAKASRTREQAALICAAVASSEHVYTTWAHGDIAATIDASPDAGALSGQAYRWAAARIRGRLYRAHIPYDSRLAMLAYAEAEALIRSGWTP